jgi:hypothetical protein
MSFNREEQFRRYQDLMKRAADLGLSLTPHARTSN